MTLIQIVAEIKKKKVSEVTEEEAKQFALDQFGLLMSYMTEHYYKVTYVPF